jgi:Asp-tRNA(Asn)/Glu-tRNA(Gln) amidotransferase A subunit family amidase
VTAAQLAQDRAEQERWRATIRPGYLALTSPVNLAGSSALALPVPTGQRLPASLQLINGPNAEVLLLATSSMIEAAV